MVLACKKTYFLEQAYNCMPDHKTKQVLKIKPEIYTAYLPSGSSKMQFSPSPIIYIFYLPGATQQAPMSSLSWVTIWYLTKIPRASCSLLLGGMVKHNSCLTDYNIAFVTTHALVQVSWSYRTKSVNYQHRSLLIQEYHQLGIIHRELGIFFILAFLQYSCSDVMNRFFL